MLLFYVPLLVPSAPLCARPADCPEPVWERVVEAERVSREKKFGTMLGPLGSALDSSTIEANQLRIWDELKRRKEGGEVVEAKPKEPGFFDGIKQSFASFYQEADAMAYSQAVALNKNLEDRGILSKVSTDAKDKKRRPPPTKKKTRSGAKGFG